MLLCDCCSPHISDLNQTSAPSALAAWQILVTHTTSKLLTLAVRRVTAVFLSNVSWTHVLAIMLSVGCHSSPLLPYLITSSHMDGISRVKDTNPTLSESHCDLYNPKWPLQSFIYENVSHPSLSCFPSFSFYSYSLSAFISGIWLEIILMRFTCPVLFSSFFYQCISARWAFWFE